MLLSLSILYSHLPLQRCRARKKRVRHTPPGCHLVNEAVDRLRIEGCEEAQRMRCVKDGNTVEQH